VNVGYRKIQINGEWFIWDEQEMGKETPKTRWKGMQGGRD
jgi:hypothetical protein